MKYVQTPPVALYTGISATATSIRIAPYPLDTDGNKLVTADFGTTAYLTIDPKVLGYEEICSFTGITDNGDNTATLTGVIRSLASKSPYTTTGNGKVHGSSAVVVFSDNPQIFNDLLQYINQISIVGAANASTIVQGLVQLPTVTQVNNGTATGSTGAALGITPDVLASSMYGLQLPTSAQKLALVGNGGTLSSTNRYVTEQGLNLNVANDQTQIIGNGSIATGEANATTKHSLIAEKFVPTISSISGITFLKNPDTGSYTGTVKIAVQADNAGTPSGSDLVSYTLSNAAWLSLSLGSFSLGSTLISANAITITANSTLKTGQPVSFTAVTGITGLSVGTLYYLIMVSTTTISFATTKANALAGTAITITGTPSSAFMCPNPLVHVTFASEYTSLVPGSSYWMVVTCSTGDNSNHPNLGINTAGGYASGQLIYNNSTDGWVTVTTSILTFYTHGGTLTKTVQTDSTNGMPPVIVRPYSFMLHHFTPAPSSGTATSDTVVWSIQLPGGFFGTDGGMKIMTTGGFVGRSSNGDAVTFKVRYNGNAFATFVLTAGSGAAAAPSSNFTVYFTILNNGATNSQTAVFYMTGIYLDGSSATSIAAIRVNQLGLNASNYSLSTVDTAVPGVLDMTYSVTNSSDVYYHVGTLVEKIGS